METEKAQKGKPLYGISRYASAVECHCGGYAKQVENTLDECAKFGCGRDTPDWSCCARAFVCQVCGDRIVGAAEAPEMD